MRWRRKRTDLAERLRPYLDTSPSTEPMVDADPIRMLRWMIETGDPIEVVAKGFDLDEQLLTDILAGERRRCQRTLLRSCASGSDWRSRARETRLASALSV